MTVPDQLYKFHSKDNELSNEIQNEYIRLVSIQDQLLSKNAEEYVKKIVGCVRLALILHKRKGAAARARRRKRIIYDDDEDVGDNAFVSEDAGDEDAGDGFEDAGDGFDDAGDGFEDAGDGVEDADVFRFTDEAKLEAERKAKNLARKKEGEAKLAEQAEEKARTVLDAAVVAAVVAGDAARDAAPGDAWDSAWKVAKESTVVQKAASAAVDVAMKKADAANVAREETKAAWKAVSAATDAVEHTGGPDDYYPLWDAGVSGDAFLFPEEEAARAAAWEAKKADAAAKFAHAFRKRRAARAAEAAEVARN